MGREHSLFLSLPALLLLSFLFFSPFAEGKGHETMSRPPPVVIDNGTGYVFGSA